MKRSEKETIKAIIVYKLKGKKPQSKDRICYTKYIYTLGVQG